MNEFNPSAIADYVAEAGGRAQNWLAAQKAQISDSLSRLNTPDNQARFDSIRRMAAAPLVGAGIGALAGGGGTLLSGPKKNETRQARLKRILRDSLFGAGVGAAVGGAAGLTLSGAEDISKEIGPSPETGDSSNLQALADAGRHPAGRAALAYTAFSGRGFVPFWRRHKDRLEALEGLLSRPTGADHRQLVAPLGDRVFNTEIPLPGADQKSTIRQLKLLDKELIRAGGQGTDMRAYATRLDQATGNRRNAAQMKELASWLRNNYGKGSRFNRTFIPRLAATKKNPRLNLAGRAGAAGLATLAPDILNQLIQEDQ